MTGVGVNAARGEAALVVDGVPRRLCLTLGALAEIETALDCHDLGGLQGRMASPSASDLIVVLAALLRGGGEADTAARIGEAELQLSDAVRAIATAFERAGA